VVNVTDCYPEGAGFDSRVLLGIFPLCKRELRSLDCQTNLRKEANLSRNLQKKVLIPQGCCVSICLFPPSVSICRPSLVIPALMYPRVQPPARGGRYIVATFPCEVCNQMVNFRSTKKAVSNSCLFVRFAGVDVIAIARKGLWGRFSPPRFLDCGIFVTTGQANFCF
jgi:hypothetical protein